MIEPLLADSRSKLRATLELVFASATGYTPFAPGRIYSPREREPHDALSDRFITWIALRDLRNRVVHDYLPDELAELYAAIVGEAVPEFRRLDAAITDRLR
jgi:hypothetical protein